MEPNCDTASEVPIAVLRLEVGNNSDVWRMMTANTAESANLPSNATTRISNLFSEEEQRMLQRMVSFVQGKDPGQDFHLNKGIAASLP